MHHELGQLHRTGTKTKTTTTTTTTTTTNTNYWPVSRRGRELRVGCRYVPPNRYRCAPTQGELGPASQSKGRQARRVEAKSEEKSFYQLLLLLLLLLSKYCAGVQSRITVHTKDTNRHEQQQQHDCARTLPRQRPTKHPEGRCCIARRSPKDETRASVVCVCVCSISS